MKMRRFWPESAERLLAQHLGSKMITKIADEPSRFCGVFGEAALKAHTSPVTATSKVLLSRFLSIVGGRYHSDQIECF